MGCNTTGPSPTAADEVYINNISVTQPSNTSSLVSLLVLIEPENY